jgi:prepilin-type N-terminal cleavage/methylation domain-containing protein
MMGNPGNITTANLTGRLIGVECGDDGFTLLELITSLVLLGLLAAVFGMGIAAAVKSNAFSRANVQLAQRGQIAMARISREIRELTSIEAISAAGEDTYIIYYRLPEGTTQRNQRYAIHFSPTDQTLRIYSSTTVNPPLNESTISQSDILVDKVRGFSLNYYQGNLTWSWGSNPSLLSSIQVILQLERPDDPAATQTFQTLVHLRNSENYGGATYTTNPPTRNEYSCFISSMGRDLPFFRLRATDTRQEPGTGR